MLDPGAILVTAALVLVLLVAIRALMRGPGRPWAEGLAAGVCVFFLISSVLVPSRSGRIGGPIAFREGLGLLASAIVSGVVAMVWAACVRHAWRRQAERCCQRCGQPLPGPPEPRCPSCGLPFEPEDDHASGRPPS